MTLESQSLNLNARQILIKRLSTVQALDYTGPMGELILDTTLKLLRIQDGVTPGGILISSEAFIAAKVANLQSQINSILSNIDPAAIDSFTEILANIANNTESQLVNSGFYANLTTTGNLVVDGNILPKNNLQQDLGSPTQAWRDLYLSSSTAHFGNAEVTVNPNGLAVSRDGVSLPFVGNVRFPDGSVQQSAVDQATVANIYQLLSPTVAANLRAIDSNITSYLANASSISKTWTNPITSNVWTTVEYTNGIIVENVERRTAAEELVVTQAAASTLPQFDSNTNTISVITVSRTAFPDLSDIADGYTLNTIVNGNINIAGVFANVSSLDLDGNSFIFTLDESIADYPAGANVTFTYNTTNLGIPVPWFDVASSPYGANNFKGAVIDYHAGSDVGTVIGTIKIANNANKTHVTHLETTSGDSTMGSTILWGRFEDNETKLYYYRSDGTSSSIAIHYTAKLFYADYGA